MYSVYADKAVENMRSSRNIQDSIADFQHLVETTTDTVYLEYKTGDKREVVERASDGIYYYTSDTESESQLRKWYNTKAIVPVSGEFKYEMTQTTGMVSVVDIKVIQQEYKRKTIKSVKMICTTDNSLYALLEKGSVKTNLHTKFVPFFTLLVRKQYNKFR